MTFQPLSEIPVVKHRLLTLFGDMKTRTKVVTNVCVLLSMLVVLCWFMVRPVGPLNVSAHVLWETNLFGQSHVVMAITNHSAIAVRRYTKIWYVEDVASGARVDCYDAVDGMPIPRPAYVEIGPGQSRVTTVPFPTNQSPWRAVFRFAPVNWKMKLSQVRAGAYPRPGFRF